MRRPFALEQEPAPLRDRYGRHPLGQYLLMARRLVEAGVGFVSVNGWCGYAPGENSQGGAASFTWDMHGGQMGQGNIFGTGSYGLGWRFLGLMKRSLPCWKISTSAACSKTTLVVVTGEFGRTPKITGKNGINGRDHWTSCWSALIAGAGIGGGVYGASDKIGAYVKDNPVRPQDLGATVYQALGVPLNTQTQVGGAPDHHGRADPEVVQLRTQGSRERHAFWRVRMPALSRYLPTVLAPRPSGPAGHLLFAFCDGADPDTASGGDELRNARSLRR